MASSQAELQRDIFEKHMSLGARLRILADLATKVEADHVNRIVIDYSDQKYDTALTLALDSNTLADRSSTGFMGLG